MAAVRMALRVARVPALVVLLWMTAPPVEGLNRAMSRLEERGFLAAWVVVSLVGMTFVVVMLVGRRHRHPWALLAVEAGVAATLAFVPPVYWVFWRGIDSWSIAMTGGFAQPLAMAWLGVVGLRALHQLRETAAASGSAGVIGPHVRGHPLELIDDPNDA